MKDFGLECLAWKILTHFPSAGVAVAQIGTLNHGGGIKSKITIRITRRIYLFGSGRTLISLNQTMSAGSWVCRPM